MHLQLTCNQECNLYRKGLEEMNLHAENVYSEMHTRWKLTKKYIYTSKPFTLYRFS